MGLFKLTTSVKPINAKKLKTLRFQRFELFSLGACEG